jgi:hypothetical protein
MQAAEALKAKEGDVKAAPAGFVRSLQHYVTLLVKEALLPLQQRKPTHLSMNQVLKRRTSNWSFSRPVFLVPKPSPR